MFEFGEITDIDAVRGYVKVYIPETGNTTEWIPFIRPFYAASIPFEINEQVLVGRTGSDRWFVLGSSPNDVDKPYTGASASKMGIKFTDGTLIEYDIATSKYTINTTGDIDITCAATVNIISADQINLTAPAIVLSGAVTIDGVMSAAGGIELTGGHLFVSGGDIATDGNVSAGSISLATHVHGGVTTGGGVSGVPV